MPPLWVLSFFGFFAGDALIAGFALEIVPTHYRATVSGLRYLVEIWPARCSLALEGRLYDHFHGHGPAIQALLIAVPITLIAMLFLPEPAAKPWKKWLLNRDGNRHACRRRDIRLYKPGFNDIRARLPRS